MAAAELSWYFAWIQLALGVALLVSWWLWWRLPNPSFRFFAPLGTLTALQGMAGLTMGFVPESVWWSVYVPAFVVTMVWGIQSLRRSRREAR